MGARLIPWSHRFNKLGDVGFHSVSTPVTDEEFTEAALSTTGLGVELILTKVVIEPAWFHSMGDVKIAIDGEFLQCFGGADEGHWSLLCANIKLNPIQRFPTY